MTHKILTRIDVNNVFQIPQLTEKKKILQIGAKNPDAQVTAYTDLPINKSKNSSQSFRNLGSI